MTDLFKQYDALHFAKEVNGRLIISKKYGAPLKLCKHRGFRRTKVLSCSAALLSYRELVSL